MLGQREALHSDLHRKCKVFEEEGGDLPQSELLSDGEKEEGEKLWKSDGDSQRVVQGCTCHISMLIDCVDQPTVTVSDKACLTINTNRNSRIGAGLH